MSEEQLKSFLKKVKMDTSLQEKLKAAADDDAVVEIAKEAGFVISSDELKQAQVELSEDDLESISGGVLNTCFFQGRLTSPYDSYGSPSGCG